jgi:putative flippase GtrA
MRASWLPRAFRFAVAGGAAAAINLATVWLCVEWVFRGGAALSVGLGVFVSTAAGFFLHRSWTWADRRRRSSVAQLVSELVRSYGVCSMSAVLQWLVAVGAHELLGAHYLAASIAGIGVAAVTNYVAAGRWVFAAQRTQLAA